jgi:hypothetical protein
MKNICLLLIALFWMSPLFSQVLYDEGIVKGKNVTYEVSRGKGHSKAFTYIRNMNNPDTTFREEPNRDIIPAQLVDIEMQVAEIIHDYFSPEELVKMGRQTMIAVKFRLDAQKRTLLQVTNFFYVCEEPFWANLSPDRLHELEQLILKKLELPTKLQETYFEADFSVAVFGDDIQNVEETREKRKRAVEYWKQNDIKVKVIPQPKFISREESNKEKTE